MSNTTVALTATSKDYPAILAAWRDMAYGALAKGQTPAQVLTTLTTYVAEMENWASGTTAKYQERKAEWAPEKAGLRVLYAEVQRIGRGEAIDASPAAATRTEAGPDQGRAKTALPNGTYTVAFPDGEHRTIRLQDDWRDDAPAGSQVAQFLSGTDNTNDFTGFAFVSGRNARVWRKWADSAARSVEALNVLLRADLDGAKAMGEAYALTSGRCWRCNRLLTVPASIHRGLGPDCATKVA